jgi:hypothetical protein
MADAIERPILYQGAMVRALLAKTKTQTRRLLPTLTTMGRAEYPGRRDRSGSSRVNFLDTPEGRAAAAAECRYGKPGEQLWVREAWRANGMWDCLPPSDIPGRTDLHYEADGRPNAHFCFGKLRPGIHMPRAASRIQLTVTNVRVQLLQEISEADAIAEGIQKYQGPLRWVRYLDPLTGEAAHNTARDAYAALWDGINGRKPNASWDANPWVWAVSFKLVRP